MADPARVDPVFTVLLVCTGNICRSAFAERLGRAFAAEEMGDDAHLLRLVSAGTGAAVGSPMHPSTALVLEGFGGDPTGFAAQQLLWDMALDADLVLTLTRAHRDAVLELEPRALSRTFTLLEAAALSASLQHGEPIDGEDFAGRGRSLVRAMAGARSRRAVRGADVPDPIGRSVDVHQEVAEQIAAALLPLLRRLVALRDPAHRYPPAEPTGTRRPAHGADGKQPATGGLLRRLLVRDPP